MSESLPLPEDPLLATWASALNDAGYMSRPVWTLMHKLPMFARCPRMDLHVALGLEARVINIPSSARLGH